jgi:hypothetical protein
MTSRKVAAVFKIFFWAIVAVIAGLVLLMFYRGENPFNIIDTNQGPLSILNEQTISDNITSITVGWNVGGVTVKVSADDKIHIVERSHEAIAQNKWATVTVSGEALRITSKNKNAFFFIFWHSPQTYLELSLPAKVYETFNLNVTSGNNEIRDLAVKTLDINSTSGNLDVKNIDVETLRFTMTSGHSDYANAKTHVFDGVMTSGDLSYDGVVDQRLDLTMTSGQFNTTLLDTAPQTIDFNMTSGVSRFTLPATSDFTMSLSKTTGIFSANFEHTQNGNKYTYKTGRDDYRLGMTSGSLTLVVQN